MELGSNYELDIEALKETEDDIFSYLNCFDTRYLDSGRSAIRALKPLLEKGTILLPNYICESVTAALGDSFEIQFYRLNADFSIDLQDLLKRINEKVKAVYIMNYFGMVQEQECLHQILELKKKYNFVIVEDTTHSIFSDSNAVGDYCICSLRKWFPIADGGVLYTKHELPEHLGEALEKKKPSRVFDAMILKHWFLQNVIDSNHLYRKLFGEEEKKLDEQRDIYSISDLSGNLLQYFSVGEMVEKRKKNYLWVSQYYRNHPKRGISPVFKNTDFVPLVFPIYVEKRDELRRYLMEHQIYCAVHWPLEGTGLCGDVDAEHKSAHILSLPIDQRYGEAHMEYLCRILDEFEG
ncbi:MAG: aminotransferase class I/II-fold pyridoxal phosphate-dependent enzyme [Roseburia sp.]